MGYDRNVTTNRLLLRQEIGRILREITIGNVDAGTLTTIQDDDLIDAGESLLAIERAWIRCKGETRRMTTYVPTTGTITVGRAFSVTPADQYEIHRMFSPDEIDEIIGRALNTCVYEREEVIDLVDDQTEYDLSSYTWIIHPSMITGVFLRSDDGDSHYRYSDMPWWRIARVSAAETTLPALPPTGLYLRVKALWGDDDKIVIRGATGYKAPTNDTQGTSCPWDWALAAVEMQVYKILTRDSPAEDAKRYRLALQEAGLRWQYAYRLYAPRPQHRVLLPDNDAYYYNDDMEG